VPRAVGRKASQAAERSVALKGHGFSRADDEAQNVLALAAEGCIESSQIIPPGLKLKRFLAVLWHS
jgi:hypothetical protein